VKTIPLLLLAIVLAGLTTTPQEKELWPKWDKGKVNKMLNSSPWAQTQTDTDTSEMTYSPTSASGSSSIGSTASSSAGARNTGRDVQGNRSDQGASNQALSVNYHVRFLSAKPIRQAFARMIEIQEKDNKSVRDQLGPFVERDFSDYIVVAVSLAIDLSRASRTIFATLTSSGGGLAAIASRSASTCFSCAITPSRRSSSRTIRAAKRRFNGLFSAVRR